MHLFSVLFSSLYHHHAIMKKMVHSIQFYCQCALYAFFYLHNSTLAQKKEWMFNLSSKMRMEEGAHWGGVYHRFLILSALYILGYVYLELHVSHLHLFMELVLSGFKPRPLRPINSPGQLLCMFQGHPYILMCSCRIYQIQKSHTDKYIRTMT